MFFFSEAVSEDGKEKESGVRQTYMQSLIHHLLECELELIIWTLWALIISYGDYNSFAASLGCHEV